MIKSQLCIKYVNYFVYYSQSKCLKSKFFAKISTYCIFWIFHPKAKKYKRRKVKKISRKWYYVNYVRIRKHLRAENGDDGTGVVKCGFSVIKYTKKGGMQLCYFYNIHPAAPARRPRSGWMSTALPTTSATSSR